MHPAYRIDEPDRVLSPSLVIFRELVRGNIASMIAMAGRPERLRPHVKTHKMPAIIRMLEAAGIHKHKCATLAEAEMVAAAGGEDVLIAYPMVGPNISRLVRLTEKYPSTIFRVLVDEEATARALSAAFSGLSRPLSVLIDLDVGMGRTGIGPEEAGRLAALLGQMPGLVLTGLHAYDGHIRDKDLDSRRESARPGQQAALELFDRLRTAGLPVSTIVLGGTPTFPIHAECRHDAVECSPGTVVLHDASYSEKFPDLPFTPAALIFTRVISRPGRGRVCLDLGYKAVASDPKGDRLKLLGVDDTTLSGQSEEHLVVETSSADSLTPGTPLLAIPMHVCPTCALHQEASVFEAGQLVDVWPVTARDRRLTL